MEMEAKRTVYVNMIKEAFRHNLHRIDSFTLHNSILQVYGPPRCGKTSLVLKTVSNRPHVSYISFKNLTEAESKILFAKEALRHTGKTVPAEWNAIFECYKDLPTPLHQVLILDDIDQIESYKDFKDAFLGFINDESYERLFVVLIGEKELFSWRTDHVAGESVFLNYLSLFDTRQLVPDMDSYNALQVYAATGGIPELVKMFSEFPDFETAVPSVLRYYSEYNLFMKRLIGQAFRKPELYNAILSSIAAGSVRNGQISQAIGEANNKTDKYCRALIDVDFLEKSDGNYSFTNSYFELWYKLLYPNSFALHRPEAAADCAADFIQAVAVAAKTEYVKAAMLHCRENNYGFSMDIAYARECVPVPMEVTVDGNPYSFDGVVEKDGHFSFIKVLQGKDLRLDRVGTELLEKAASQIAPLYNSHLEVYSYNAFHDYPVRLAAELKYLHLNALERLKWR